MFQNLNIDNESDLNQIYLIGNALASPIRVAILSQLKTCEMSVTELAKINFVSVSSIMFHLNLLKKANLVNIVTIKTNRIQKRIVNRSCFNINIDLFLENAAPINTKKYFESMPVGCFINAEFGNKSGYVTTKEAIGLYGDGPFIPARFDAQIVYVNNGFVEYAFNNGKIRDKKVKEISFTLEICSEAPYYNNNFKSDIIFSINGIELLTYTSPGDFGGRHGKYTPEFLSLNSSQYGIIKTILVNELGVYLDNVLINPNIKISSLCIEKGNHIKLKVESKIDAENQGGFNIFGKNAGDYPHDIEMVVTYYDKNN